MPEITYDDFVETYRPIQNHIDTNASFDGMMFETFGDERDFVREQDPNTIWTLIEEDGDLFVSAGWHFVNRLGYFITAVPWTDPDLTTANLNEPDPDYNDN